MLKRKMYALFILFGVVLFLLAACSKASESVPSATPSNAATSSQASVSEPKNDEPTVTPTTDTEQQPARSFVELATGGTGSASFIAEPIAHFPGSSPWYPLYVQITDGIITISSMPFVQSASDITPDIIYEESLPNAYPELADTFAKIKAGKNLFVLEHDGQRFYACFVDDTLYFLEISLDRVYRVFRVTENVAQQPARSFVEIAAKGTNSTSFTAEVFAQNLPDASPEIEIRDGKITIDGTPYVQSPISAFPCIPFTSNLYDEFPELSNIFDRLKSSEVSFMLEPDPEFFWKTKWLVVELDDALYFLEPTTNGFVDRVCKAQPVLRPLTEVVTHGMNSGGFTAETFAQAPYLSSWRSLAVAIRDGSILINDVPYTQSDAVDAPAISYEESLLSTYPELADIFAKLQGCEECYVLEAEQTGNALYVYAIEGSLYFIRLPENGVVERIHSAKIPLHSFVDVATKGTGSASFTVDTFAQCPYYSWWHSLEVEIRDGQITIDGKPYVQSDTVEVPAVTFDESILSFYPQLADAFAAIKESEECFVLETDQASTYMQQFFVYEIYGSFYFLSCSEDGVVVRIHSTKAAPRSFVDVVTKGTGSVSLTADVIAQLPAMSSRYSPIIEVRDGKIMIDDVSYVQSSIIHVPTWSYSESILQSYPELADTFAKIKGSETAFVLIEDESGICCAPFYAYLVDDTLYFLFISDIGGIVVRINGVAI